MVQNSSFRQRAIQLGETKFGLLAYANDLVLLVENKKIVIEQTRELLEAAKII